LLPNRLEIPFDWWDHSHYEEETEDQREATVGPYPPQESEKSLEAEPLGKQQVGE
jgi:hypothetical protein